jgi:hypothetical protein
MDPTPTPDIERPGYFSDVEEGHPVNVTLLEWPLT